MAPICTHRRRTEYLRSEATDPIPQPAVGGDDIDDTVTDGCDDIHDTVVAAAGRLDDLDPPNARDTAGAALDHEHHLAWSRHPCDTCVGDRDQAVAKAFGGATTVTPPPVGHGPDDVRGVDDEHGPIHH